MEGGEDGEEEPLTWKETMVGGEETIYGRCKFPVKTLIGIMTALIFAMTIYEIWEFFKLVFLYH